MAMHERPAVVAHELGHLVLAVRVGTLPFGTTGRPALEFGTVHEAVGDLVAASTTRSWDIDGIRDLATGSNLADPALGLEHALAERPELANDPHWLSGLLSRPWQQAVAPYGWSAHDALLRGTLDELAALGSAERVDLDAFASAAVRAARSSQATPTGLADALERGMLQAGFHLH
jgi:hypothetical protein